MSEDEFKERCDKCLKSGGQTFARIFYTRLGGKWKHVCETCWNRLTGTPLTKY